jgi:hypothetical protein
VIERDMEEQERYRRRLKVRHQALRRLGVTNIQCICGETDPLCFEADHIYRRALDGTCWGICVNCHKKRSARGWSEDPPIRPEPHDPLERIVHLLLGVATYLEFIVAHLRSAAEFLLGLLHQEATSGE